MNTDIYKKIVERIITEQEGIIGPIAVEHALRIKGLSINWPIHKITFKGKEQEIIDDLVENYRDFFGQVSVNVCRHATSKLISQLPVNQQPTLLR